MTNPRRVHRQARRSTEDVPSPVHPSLGLQAPAEPGVTDVPFAGTNVRQGEENMSRSWTKAVLAALLCLVPVIGAAQGRTTGQIVGTVRDASGGVVPKADLILIDNGTGSTTEAKSGSDGGFVFPNLQPGRYQITATFQGFNPITIQEVVVETARSVDLVMQFEVAGLTEQVRVEGARRSSRRRRRRSRTRSATSRSRSCRSPDATSSASRCSCLAARRAPAPATANTTACPAAPSTSRSTASTTTRSGSAAAARAFSPSRPSGWARSKNSRSRPPA